MNTLETIEEKLVGISLKPGIHADREDGMCAMEAAAYLAGEPHTDHPVCACPAITAFMLSFNDGMADDADRDRWLKPLVPLMVGSLVLNEDGQMDTDVLVHRANLCAIAARQFAPLALETGGAAIAADRAAHESAEYAESAAECAAIGPKSTGYDATAAGAKSAFAASAAKWAATPATTDKINEICTALVRDMLAVTSAKGATK